MEDSPPPQASAKQKVPSMTNGRPAIHLSQNSLGGLSILNLEMEYKIKHSGK